jgi:hypothetical protein
MKRNQWAYKNLVLGAEFDKYMVEHPKIVEKIPDKSTLVLLPEYDRELYEANLKLAKRRVKKGEQIIFVRIKNLAPPRSRIIGAKIQCVTSS